MLYGWALSVVWRCAERGDAMLCEVCCMAFRCVKLLSKKWVNSPAWFSVLWLCVVWAGALLCGVVWRGVAQCGVRYVVWQGVVLSFCRRSGSLLRRY